MTDSLPEVLFHYTTQPGFLGIVKTHTLWAGKIHYLNDHTEYELALQMAKDILLELRPNADAERQVRIDCLLRNIPRINLLNVCVASLTAEPDILSQWRGYSKEAGGYAIGFRSEALLATCTAQGYALKQCVYDGTRQRRMVVDLVERSLAQDFNTKEGYVDRANPYTVVVLPTGGDFAYELARLAPLIKSAAFMEEREWRLISTTPLQNRQLKFRPGASMIIPYHEFDLGKETANYISSVTLGPTPHQELAKAATNAVLSCSHANVRVTCSKIPFRNW